MNDSLRDLLNGTVNADAARLDGHDFASSHGGSVARRVRHRRAVRTAGVGSVAAVSVGAVALGAAQLPWGAWGSLTPGDCPPGTIAVTPAPFIEAHNPMAHTIDVSRDRDPGTWLLWDDVDDRQVLTAVPWDAGLLKVTDATGDIRLYGPTSDGTFAFAVPTGGYAIYKPDTELALEWQFDEPAALSVEYVHDLPRDEPGASVLTPDGTVIAGSESSHGGITVVHELYGLTIDDGVNERILIEVRGDEVVQVESGGVSVLRVQDDGSYVVDLPGGQTVSFTVDHDRVENIIELWSINELASPHIYEEVWEVPAEASPPEGESSVTCVTPTPTLTPSPAPSTEPPVGDEEPAAPLQCGFRMEGDEVKQEDWAITEAAWLEPQEAWSTLDDWYSDPLASFQNEPTGPVAYIEADGSFFDDRFLMGVRGGLGDDAPDGVHYEVLHQDGFGSKTLAFVAAVDGEVIATIDRESDHRDILVDRDDASAATSAFLLSNSAFEVCGGADEGALDGADIYGISTVAAVADDGTVELVQVWRQLPPRP